MLDTFQIMYLIARITQIAGFGLLFASELAVYVFSLGAPSTMYAYMRHPPMAVHACSFIYYVLEMCVNIHTMLDAFGRPVYPLRYILWTCSVSCMFISIYFVVDSTHRVANAVSLRRVLHDDLAQGLLCTNGMFATGFLSAYPWGEDRRHINAFCFLVSCYCFYGALGHIDQMLKSNQTVARDCGAAGLAFQFSIVRKTFFCVWHLFPMVWALAACGSLSIQVEHIGYIVADVVNKFLLMFVYIVSVNNFSAAPTATVEGRPVFMLARTPSP